MKRVLSNIGSEEVFGTYRVIGIVSNQASTAGEVVSAAPARVVFYEGTSYPKAMEKMEELRTVMATGGAVPDQARA